ncbi:ABC transporter substrate-binding protein [Nocardioides kongjuensis]|uniref:Polar amino acid transport system substrate-binding protein n=1 Tax=Nocardioides kongjuensis TaxID=349522 RepID=A0A852RMD6_9ACTN|nr:ABC transporter substrate-binding protein [Nocardioides kongjuensis]NYD29184.1 polar amino acid transport system substrate-binding protein [Nocardioides kongjuensis]
MKITRTTLAAATTVAAALAVTACAAPDDGTSAAGGPDASATLSAQKVDADAAGLLPADIKDAGVVKVASGVSFPPMEYFDTDNKTVLGFDADLGKALGEVLGVEFDFQNTNFDGIIGGLTAHRYDLGLTSMIDKPERQTQVDFVDYLSSGVTFLVMKGNPDGLTEQSDLCGRAVAVEKAATGDLVADDISKDCEAAGKKPVDKSPLPDQASAIQALQSGRADAVLALDLTLAYNVKQNPDTFEVPAKPFGTLPVGIAFPKDSTGLRDAVAAALKVLQDNGTYDDLLAKWNLTAQALTGAPINAGK